MSGPESETPGTPEHTPRRVPTGAIVLAGSVAASLAWWMLMPAPPPKSTPAPPPVSPAPAPEVSPAPEPATPRDTGRRKPVTTPGAPTPAPPDEAPAPVGPLLRVSGDVPGADVFVDRTFVGKAPFETRDITAGPHQINVSAPGYDGVSERVEVAASGPTEMTFSLKTIRLDATVDVVHKHGMGSCDGRLRATVAGLEYVPKEGRDGFQVALSGLEQFGLDYQEKQLRVKIKGGRTFNFTTRAPNADPLFVFHRDVEKARQKMAGGS